MEQFPDFFLYPCRYCADFLACKSITSVLKSSIQRQTHFLYDEDDQIPSFTSESIPPGIHAAGRGLGIAIQYFQNACSNKINGPDQFLSVSIFTFSLYFLAYRSISNHGKSALGHQFRQKNLKHTTISMPEQKPAIYVPFELWDT